MVGAPRRSRPWLFALAVMLVVPSLSAVIVEFLEWHGKQIRCIHGGLRFFHPKFCLRTSVCFIQLSQLFSHEHAMETIFLDASKLLVSEFRVD